MSNAEALKAARDKKRKNAKKEPESTPFTEDGDTEESRPFVEVSKDTDLPGVEEEAPKVVEDSPPTEVVTTPEEATFNFTIESLGERDKFANVLIYGESGVGKTTFASTAPRPVLWLEAEGGTNSIADPEGIDIVKMTDLESYREVLAYLHKNPGRYKSIVIDSLSEVQAQILKDIMRGVKRDDPARDEFAPQFGEWGKLTGVMREIVRAYRDLPANVIFTALTREDADPVTARVKVRPKLSPALAEEVPAFMDACLYLYAATPKKGETGSEGVDSDEDGVTIVRNALLKPTGKYVAKVRAPKGQEVPDFLPDPTYQALAPIMGVES